MTEDTHEPNPNPDPNKAVTPASKALFAIEALGTALNKVDTATVTSRSGLPMLQFKRDNNGTWQHGQKRTIPEESSRWAANPMSFKHGFICFSEANKPLGERLVSISQPMPDVTELPDHGHPWAQQWAVNLRCLSGVDAGVEVVYKPTTVGGVQAVAELINAVRDRYNGGLHEDKLSPIVTLGKEDYQHSSYGRIWNPVLSIVSWMTIDGPTSEDSPPPPPPPVPPAAAAAASEQPSRRRRVG
jgi:hypothetical protein